MFKPIERTGNCTVETIPTWMGDAAKMEGRPVRLKLASELLQVMINVFTLFFLVKFDLPLPGRMLI